MTQGSGHAGKPGVALHGRGAGQAYSVEYNDLNLKKQVRSVIN